MSSIQSLSRHRRVLVVGSGGRLGKLLVSKLQKENIVVGLTHGQLDLSCPSSIKNALDSLDYDIVIIAGALTQVDYCETHEEEAFAVNAAGPGRIAEISAHKNARVVFISTDMVYDGRKDDPYSELDRATPINVYGASKLRGEEYVLNASTENLVIRVSWLYGPGKPAFPEWIINKACAEPQLFLPGNKIACPTSCVDLSGLMGPMLFGPDDEHASGIFNICNSRSCTWRDWGQFCIEVARHAGLPVMTENIMEIPVDSVPSFRAKRPMNSAMRTDKFTMYTGIEPRNWQEAMQEFLLQSELFSKYDRPLFKVLSDASETTSAV